MDDLLPNDAANALVFPLPIAEVQCGEGIAVSTGAAP